MNIQAFLYELICSGQPSNYLDHLHVIDKTEKDRGSVLDLPYYHDNLLMVIDSVYNKVAVIT